MSTGDPGDGGASRNPPAYVGVSADMQLACCSARGPDVNRRSKPLLFLNMAGSKRRACTHFTRTNFCFGRTPPVQNAIVERPESAQLRRPRLRSAASAIRRAPTFNHSRRAILGGPSPRRRGPPASCLFGPFQALQAVPSLTSRPLRPAATLHLRGSIPWRQFNSDGIIILSDCYCARAASIAATDFGLNGLPRSLR